jgi:hypothetical protein
VGGVWNGGLFIEGGTRWEGSEKTLARCAGQCGAERNDDGVSKVARVTLPGGACPYENTVCVCGYG